MGDLWIFGYGSLVWNPGFNAVEACSAKLYGLHRSLCIYSWVYRGTRQAPGLVFGLDKGGSCHGIGFRVQSKNREETIEYLRKRELVTDVYKETWRHIRLQNGNIELALTYMADHANPQYSGRLELEKQIELVSTAQGNSGSNCEYVLKTIEGLRENAIYDEKLEEVVKNIKIDRSLRPLLIKSSKE